MSKTAIIWLVVSVVLVFGIIAAVYLYANRKTEDKTGLALAGLFGRDVYESGKFGETMQGLGTIVGAAAGGKS